MENKIEKAISSIRSNYELWKKGEIKDGAFSWHLNNNLLLIELSHPSVKGTVSDECIDDILNKHRKLDDCMPHWITMKHAKLAVKEALSLSLSLTSSKKEEGEVQNITPVYDVKDLRNALENLPDDRIVMCQVVGQDGSAWNMRGSFCKQVQNGNISVLTFKHDELKTLPMPASASSIEARDENYINRLKAEYFEKGLNAKNQVDTSPSIDEAERQCDSCKFLNECRFSIQNINNSCKFYIKEMKVEND